MKDARGHGSGARGGTLNGKPGGIGMAAGGTFGNVKAGAGGHMQTDTQRTVQRVRGQLANAQGPGHRSTLLQGLKNLIGIS